MKASYPRSTSPKRCTRCGLVKDAEKFSAERSSRDGLRLYCKACDAERQLARPKNPRSTSPKRCIRCNIVKGADQFSTSVRAMDGLHAYCKACDGERLRAYRIPRVYGMSLEEYEALLAEGCAVCGSFDRLGMDHCHATSKTRAPLCGSCNTALGLTDDNPGLLRALADYLESHAS